MIRIKNYAKNLNGKIYETAGGRVFDNYEQARKHEKILFGIYLSGLIARTGIHTRDRIKVIEAIKENMPEIITQYQRLMTNDPTNLFGICGQCADEY